ncbi:beta strand repeat-containing protein [Stutzerimonas stutzeri]|uniref:beta strand repeat-containing protein n=1 Tax=Stutzerimonas stutzeri TaxID=316 RepID=UPI001F3AA241|nr:VCBS domain-containing protein [Stutzerimonas stutzeri]
MSATDADAGATRTWSVQGTPSTTYGDFVLDTTTGVWTYTLDNTLTATQALKEGEEVTQTYVARVTDDFGAYVDQTVTITITGSNDVPLVTNSVGALAGSITEAGHLDDGTVATGTASATGTLSATDIDTDGTQTWGVQGTPSTAYGTFAIDAATGAWTYTLDNTLAATQALKEGEEVTQTYTARVTDDFGAYIDQVVTITITGSNDVPVVSNAVEALAGSVSEAGHLDDGTVAAGTASATGTLSATDIDTDATQTWGVQGTPSTAYGTFAIDAATGVWTYTLDNTLTATQALKEGEEVTQTYTARVTDDFGAYIDQVVTITITGSNDVPLVTNSVGALAGSVSEAGHLDDGTVVAGTASATGTLSATDADAGATRTWSVQGTPSTTYGDFVLDTTTGVWTYTLDNTLAATQALKEGEEVTQTYTARVTDEFGAYIDQVVTITITGSNDVPVVSNAVEALAGSVSEAGHLDDGTVVAGTASATGTLSATDSDAGATRTWSVQGTPSTIYGDFVLDTTTGVWTYTLDNTLAATQALKEGEEVTQTYTARVTDELGAYVDQTVTITITGTNDAPIANAANNSASEDAAAVTGTLTSSDVDAASATYTLDSPVAGLTLDSNGNYSFDPAHPAYQYLGAGTTVDVVAAYTVTDDKGAISSSTLTITVAGATDNYVGTDGSDTLTGGADADTMSGGLGDDTYVVTDARNVVIEESGEGTDEVRTNLDSYTLGDNLENLVFTGTDDATGTGNALDNTITGNSGNDTLDGGAGADTLTGGAGNDAYIVDDAGDLVVEAADEGIDTVQTDLSSYTLTANVENLVLTNAGGASGTGNALDNTITGTAGNDTLDGGTGADALTGGTGDDTYVIDNAGDVINEAADAGNDTVQTSLASYTLGENLENLTLTAASGATGTGNTLDNVITGSTGNDTLDGGAGSDTLSGGNGNDTLVYDANDTLIDGGAGTDTLLFRADANLKTDTVTLSNIEVLDLRNAGGGTAEQVELSAADVRALLAAGTTTLTVEGDAGDRIFVTEQWQPGSTAGGYTTFTREHNAETLTLRLATGVNLVATLEGSGGDDTLTGGGGGDTLDGGEGNDTINGGAGADTMTGGTGNDSYWVDNSGDIVNENADEGIDEIRTTLTTVSLADYPAIDNISYTDSTYLAPGSGAFTGTGNALDNAITGGNGADTLTGAGGNDTLSGGGGNDLFIGDAGNDIIDGGTGTDTIDYSAESSDLTLTLTTGAGNSSGTVTGNDTISNVENIIGGSGNDSITGSDDFNRLEGGLGNDSLSGGLGNDTLLGGTGDDTLDGGAGNDTLIGGAGNDTYIGGSGTDLADFSGAASAISISLTNGTGTDDSGGSDTFSGVENVTGGSGNDVLIGDTNANRLDGGAGDDTIVGAAGSDTLIGGLGTDTLDYSTGSAAVVVNMGSTSFAGVAANTATDGMGGTDSVSGFENVLGGSGGDTLVGGTGDNVLEGKAGNDLLSGGAGNDNLLGGDGDDSLRGGAGNDNLDGGAHASGGDTADYSDQGTAVNVSLATGSAAGGSIGTDTLSNIENISGGSNHDTLTGDSGDNQIWGNAGNDTIAGGDGNDRLRGGQGADNIDGGDGIDAVLYDDITGPVIVNLGAANFSTTVRVAGTDYNYTLVAGSSQAITQAGSTAGTDTLLNIENIVGSGGADILVGSAGDNVIDGANGGDTIDGGAGNDTIYYDENDALVDGGDGTDTLMVGSAVTTLDLTLVRDEVFRNFEILDITDASTQVVNISDSDIRALAGDGVNGTLIIKGGAEDSVRLIGANWPTSNIPTEDIGGTTYKVYSYNGATVKIDSAVAVGYLFVSDESGETSNGSDGGDLYTGNGGDDTFNAGGGDDLGDGGSGNDTLVGGSGNDTLAGGTGNDTLYGGDTLDSAGSGNDNLDGGSGDDQILAGDGDDTVDGGSGNDAIDAGSGNDSVSGGDGSDSITAGSGNDTVDGGSGNDAINAGDGDDNVNAGIGDDSVVGGAGNDTLDGSSGVDTIDYSAETDAVTVNLTSGNATGTGSGNDTLQNFENILGGAGNDTLTGNDAANRVDGGAGSDSISTGAGNDWIRFDADDTLVDGGSGNDTLAIATTDPVDFSAIDNNRFIGIEEIDLTGNGVQHITLGAADVLDLSDTTDTLKIHGDAGDKLTLTGNWTNAGTQPVSYNGAANQAYVKLTLAVGGVTATVLVDPALALDIVYQGDAGNDTLTGGSGDDVVDGGDGNDVLDGAGGTDDVSGGDGDDTIIYDSSDLLLDGGAGTDTLKFAPTASGLLLDFGELARPAAGGLRPALAGFEIIDITGGGNNSVVIDSAALLALSDSSDTLTIEGNTGDAVYIVGSWVDGGTVDNYQVYTKDGATLRVDTSVTVGAVVDDPNGDGDSAELIPGATAGNDVIRGLGGNDTLDGAGGADVLRGGDGNDTLAYDAADLTIDGGDGSDTLRVSSNLNLSGVAGSKVTNVEVIDLIDSGTDITLSATAADIAALNTSGTVRVDGNASDSVALAGNWISGDSVGGYTPYTLDGATLNIADAINVTVTYTGTSQGNTMVAGAGSQTLDALAGNDTLDGGSGADILLGGSGDDVLVYDAADTSIAGGAGSDTLQVQGANVTLDLTSIANNIITGVEKIDVTGNGNNTLVLNADDLQALSTDTDTLIVTGDVGDSVRLAGSGWEARGSELVAGITYNKFIGYSTDGTQVTVLGGLKMVKGDQIVGSGGDDSLVGSSGSDDIKGMGGNDSIAGGLGSDLLDGGLGNDTIVYDALDTRIAGGDGSDTLDVVSSGNIIDLQEPGRPTAGALRPELAGFETIDLNTSGANTLILDEATLSGLAGGTLTVNGNGDDIVFVDGTLTSGLVLNGVTQTALTRGTGGDDSITGTAGRDAIKTDGGNDTIDGGLGADIIYSGTGNDQVLYDAADLRVFGGAGNDTLVIRDMDADGGVDSTSDGTNTAAGDVDLTLLAGSIVKGFETIELRENGDQTVKLDEASVLALSDTGHVTVMGDIGDVLKLYGAWVYSDMESDADGRIYTVMQKGDAYVHVVSEVTLDITNELGGKVVVGTSGADDATVSTNGGLITGDGDDIIRVNNMSFTGVDGGRGYDKVYFQFSGTVDTSLLAPTSLTNIEEIDLATGSGLANKLILTPDKLLEMTDADGILVVKGTPGTDTIDLYGEWSDIATAPDVLYNGVTYKALTADNGGKLYYTPGMTVAVVDPTPQMSAFSVAYDDAAYLVSAGIDKFTGWKVANAGDVNADGIDDMIVNQANSAFVVFGTESMLGQFDLNNLGSRGFMVNAVGNGIGGHTLAHYPEWQSLNYGLTPIGDVNGDGIADMISSTNDANQFRVIYGRTEWSDIDLTNTATFATGSSNGYTVSTNFTWGGGVLTGLAGVGDVNGDGYDDYVISNMWSTDINNSGDSGRAYLMFGGAHGGNIATNGMSVNQGIMLSSDSSNYIKLGTDVAALGDINGDGYADFAIGGPNANANAGANGQHDRSGSGYIVFGKAEGWGNTIVVQRDNTEPTFRAGASTPSDGQGNYPLAYSVEFQQAFSESIAFGSGFISLYNTTTGELVEKFDVATGLGSLGGKLSLRNWHVANDLLNFNTFNPLAPSTAYHITIDATAIRDLAGNYFAGIDDSTTWNFSTTGVQTDVTAPTLNANATLVRYHGSSTSISTNGGTTNVPTMTNDINLAPAYRLDFSFNENVKTYGTVTITQDGNVVEVFDLQTGLGSRGGSVYFHAGVSTQDQTTFGLNFGATLKGNALTTVSLAGIQDAYGNALNGGIAKTFTFTTAADTTGPALTNANRLHTPTDNAAGVSVENDIVFQADETLLPGATGSIQLRTSTNYNGVAVETFSWTEALVAVNGVYTVIGSNGGTLTINNKTVTLNPGTNLGYNTGYDIHVSAGALTDPSGNAATGYTSQGGYNFTTASGLVAVAGGNTVSHSLKVGLEDDLVISFSETVTAGTDTIGTQFVRLYNSAGTLIESFDVADSDGSNGSKGGNLSFEGYNVVIDPGNKLTLASGYYLTVDTQAIKSANAASTTYYAGASNTTTLSFSTEAAVQIDPGQLHNGIAQQWAGQQIEGVGDVDGDGVNDFVFGSYQNVTDASIPGGVAYGKYYLVFGQAGEWAPIQNIEQLKDAGRVVEIYGTAANPLSRVVEFGDLNKDGFNDLLLTSGGWYPDNDTSPQDRLASNDGDIDAGAAFVVYGQARANWTTSVNVTQLGAGGLEITGGLPQEQFGFSAASGDFNNDGTVDVIFGMPVNHRDGYNSGEAFVLNGGDFSDSLMAVGTSGNDTILGDFNANRIAGQQGNDTIYGLGGADILRGGAGNDTIGISDLDFVLVDGGTGNDTLQFVGHDINLDITGYAGASIRSFETIDLTGDGNNSLTINYAEVSYLLERELSQAYGTNTKLTINGNSGDTVTLEGPWAVVGTNATHTTYALDGLYVSIDTDITRNVESWTIPYQGATMDLFALPAGFRSSTVTSALNLDQALGTYLTNIGDVDNDGFADFAVRQDVVNTTSLPWYERWETTNNQQGASRTYSANLNQKVTNVTSGEVFIVYGKAGGLGAVNLAAPVDGNAIKLSGSASANENLGAVLGGLGDIDGDGRADMLIGATLSSKTFTFNEGGEKSGIDPTGSYDVTQGNGTYFSTSSLSPDWNSDSWASSQEGRLYFFLGENDNLVNRTGGNITTTTLANNFNDSTALPTTYDTTGAPNTDLPDRGPENNVANTVYTYTTSGTEADGSFVGNAGNQYGSGWLPVSVGDVNGDGYGDFLTGTINVKLVLGSATGWTGLDTLSSAVTWTHMNVSAGGNANLNGLTAAGDINGDGYSDFVVSNTGNGAYIVFGKSGSTWHGTTTNVASSAGSATVAASTYIASETGIALNMALTRSLGDINGDGYDDLMFAASSDSDYSAKDNGGAYVLFGAASGWSSNINLGTLAASGRGFRLTGAVDFDYAGYNVSQAGDVNGDGYKDFLIASYGDDEYQNGVGGSSGSAYLIFGRSTGWQDISLLKVQDFGIQLYGGASSNIAYWQSLGDVDGDGLDDLSYSNANGTSTTILYGNENFTSASNVGVQHITDINDVDPENGVIEAGTLNATRGAAAADTLIGNAGNDVLTGDGGADVLIGGAGNDLLKIANPGFFKLDGGTGLDIVETSATMSIDFTTLANNRVQNIEAIRLGTGDQSVTLNGLDVLNMTGERNLLVDDTNYQKGHVLVIESTDGTDTVTLGGEWTDTTVDTTVSGSGSFSVYRHGSDNIYAVIEDIITTQIA